MKTHKILTAGLIALMLGLTACSKNPVSNDTAPGGGGNPPGTTGEAYSESAFKLEGKVDTTATGYDVEGTMTVESSNGPVAFVNADVSMNFDADGKLAGISGKVEIPPPSDKVEFTNPVEAEVGYYSGAYINSNLDLGIELKDTRHYFVFYFALAVEMKIATNDDPNATKPLSIKAPIGGKAIMVIDYEDPFMYTYGEQDLIGGAGTGDSHQGLVPFSPIQPLDKFQDFDGKSIRRGKFPVYGVISVDGTVIRSIGYEVDLMSDDIFASAKVGMKAGINGKFDFDVSIKNIVGFTVPLGSASGGASFEAAGSGEVLGIMAVNGLADPDNSWWPDFVGFKPSTQMRTKGSVTSKGHFDLKLSGLYELKTPASTRSFEGEAHLTTDALTMTGRATDNGLTVGLLARVTKDSTEYGVELPGYQFDASAIEAQVDAKLDEVQKAVDDYKKAAEDYEFELSLRGLRSTLPGLVDDIKRKIDSEVAAAKKKVRDADDWCEIDLSGIDKLAKPYYDALNRLKNAALYSTDNNYFRTEIEAALRALAARKILKGSVKVSGKVKRVICISYSTTRSINERVMSDAQANQLITAANNVKYIQETSNIKIQAQDIVDQLPDKDVLERVRGDVQSGLAKIPSVDEIGMTHNHAADIYSFYAVLDGVRKDLPPYDPANPSSIVDAVSGMIITGL